MFYAQATGKESLSDIETSLKVHQNKWHELGLVSVATSTMSDGCRRRSSEIFEELFYALLAECQSHIPNRKFDFGKDLYSLDGSLISVCLSLFNWARYRKRKGACRMHTVLNNTKEIPCFLQITDGKDAEISMARETWRDWGMAPESILLFDRGYIDYAWMYELQQEGMFFVTRAKKDMNFFVRESLPVHEPGVLKDEIIELVRTSAAKAYPEKMRRVTFWDEEKQKEYVFLTNNFELSAGQVAAAYKYRWEIELFFKWIKQHLKIKTFFGTSPNAVMSQIWIAMIYFLILSYLKAQAKLKASLLEMSRIFSEVFLQKIPLIHLFSHTPSSIRKIKNVRGSPQMAFC